MFDSGSEADRVSETSSVVDEDIKLSSYSPGANVYILLPHVLATPRT